MHFETKYELGDTVYYFDDEIYHKMIKAKIIFIEANAKFTNITTQKWICYTIEWKEHDKMQTRSSTRERDLMTQEEAKAFLENVNQETMQTLFEKE